MYLLAFLRGKEEEKGILGITKGSTVLKWNPRPPTHTPQKQTQNESRCLGRHREQRRRGCVGGSTRWSAFVFVFTTNMVTQNHLPTTVFGG